MSCMLLNDEQVWTEFQVRFKFVFHTDSDLKHNKNPEPWPNSWATSRVATKDLNKNSGPQLKYRGRKLSLELQIDERSIGHKV